MRLQTIFLTLVFVFSGQSVFAESNSSSTEEAFRPVEELFEAMSQIDHKKMKAMVTEDFVLLEHGEVWSIDDLARVVKASDFKRTNYFSRISSHHEGNVAWINYWNKANFSNGAKSQDVVWLESVVVLKQEGKWVLSQMHSTRLEADRFPKGIDFKMAGK